MRILHLDEQRGWRGGEQQVRYLVRGLAERGAAQWVAGRDGSKLLASVVGIERVVPVALPFHGEADLYTAWRLAQLVSREKIDILHAHTAHAHTLACLAQRLAGRGKAVVSRRVDFPPKTDVLNRWKYRAPDRIVAISEAIARVLMDAGADRGRLRVVPSGIDPGRFAVEPLPRAELGVPDYAWLIGNVAALVGHKDHATLLSAFAEVSIARPDVFLVIAGEGPLRRQLEEQARRLSIEDRVRFLGFRDDVPRLLRALDLFVLSSREEGLGTSVLDAFAAGVPVAATSAGGIPEIVRNEETGLLSGAGNAPSLAAAILRLGADAELRSRCAHNARLLLEDRYTANAMVAGNLAVYRELIGEDL